MAPEIAMTPERLVGVGFRGWYAGYTYQDTSCWEAVWNVYARTLGPKPAKLAMGELSAWVRAVHSSRCRSIETLPAGCAGFCRDECVAVSVIAACQHDNCPALRACAFALLGSSEVEQMLEEAVGFAHVLLEVEQRLSHNAICNVSALADTGTDRPN